jgi:periplasmic copper chaperone A
MLRRSILVLALFAGLAGTAAAQTSSIEIKEAWARATPQGAQTGAAYVTMLNKGAAGDRLVSVSTPVAGEAQLHNTVDDNGVMKMRPVAGLDLKPGDTVALKPGGYHIMLMKLKGPLTEGQSFPLTLTFEKAGPVVATVTIAKAGAMTGMDMSHGAMPGMNMGK